MRTIVCILATATTIGCAQPDVEDAGSAQRRAQTHQRYGELMSRYAAIERPQPQPPATPGECDAVALWDRGNDASFRDDHAEALRLFEASLACEYRPLVNQQAFHAACQANDAARARAHFEQLAPEERDLDRAACMTFGVDPIP